MEATPAQQAVKTKVETARQALRQVYGLHPGDMSEIEKGLVQVVAILIQAVEVGVSEPPHISTFAATTDETRALEEIYASIQGGTPAPQTASRFTISFPDVDLTLEDIWPNGDAPESPTPEDVIEVMKETEYAHPMTVTSAWRLIDTLYVRHCADMNGDMEVEWDGT
jgi:hypothetical protein